MEFSNTKWAFPVKDIQTQPKEVEDPSYDFDEYNANSSDEVDGKDKAGDDLFNKLLMEARKQSIKKYKYVALSKLILNKD